jgi:polar amino acid transport system substrate-binding protein
MNTNPMSAKALPKKVTTLRQLNLWLCAILWIAVAGAASAAEQLSAVFPGFRHVDPDAFETSKVVPSAIVLGADADFAPWSFIAEDGQLRGIAIELAEQSCAEVKIACSIQASAYPGLLPSLRSGAMQGLVSGPKPDENGAAEFALTRPYFRTLGRFIVRSGSSLPGPDVRSLAGRRIGFRVNTQHARFLEKYYSRSVLTPFDDSNAMLEAVRTGQVDAIFGDSVQLSFWLKGTASKNCCAYLGKAFVHRDTFTRSMSFTVRRDAPELRAKLDAALDQLEAKGITAEIFARYLPVSVW